MSDLYLRILIDDPLPGTENMARDEAILQAVNEGQSPPTLRFYRWDEPTISLGYFQKFAEWEQQDQVIRAMPVVRRLTGGGAILHDQELTYSLTLPLHRGLPCTEIKDSYRLVHDAFIAALAERGVGANYYGRDDGLNAQRGPFFCFARRHCLDVTLNGGKILGSAQRRLKNTLLQHGSFILKNRFADQHPAATSDFSRDLPDLIEKVTTFVAEKLELRRKLQFFTPQELGLHEQFLTKYAADSWQTTR